MKTIEYCLEGKAFADGEAEKEARNFLKNTYQSTIKVSTENFILAVRALIAEEVIDCTQVVILFQGSTMHINPDGRIRENQPYRFCDYHLNWLSRILDASSKK